MTAVDWRQDLFWSVDPGESKCGVAIFESGRCVQALRSVPDELLDKLWEHLNGANPSTRPQGLVLEAFNLRPDLAAQQTGSEMGTSQMIGAVRWIARHTGTPLVLQTPSQARSMLKQAPFRDWPQRRFASYGQGFDSKMAELHGLFRISTSCTVRERADWHRSLAA